MYDLSESKVDLQVSLTIHSFMTFKILFKPFDPEKRQKHKKAKLDIFKSYIFKKNTNAQILFFDPPASTSLKELVKIF